MGKKERKSERQLNYLTRRLPKTAAQRDKERRAAEEKAAVEKAEKKAARARKKAAAADVKPEEQPPEPWLIYADASKTLKIPRPPTTHFRIRNNPNPGTDVSTSDTYIE